MCYNHQKQSEWRKKHLCTHTQGKDDGHEKKASCDVEIDTWNSVPNGHSRSFGAAVMQQDFGTSSILSRLLKPPKYKPSRGTQHRFDLQNKHDIPWQQGQLEGDTLPGNTPHPHNCKMRTTFKLAPRTLHELINASARSKLSSKD